MSLPQHSQLPTTTTPDHRSISIFTGDTASSPGEYDSRRLSTPEYRQTLLPTSQDPSGLPKPVKKPSRIPIPPPSWIPEPQPESADPSRQSDDVWQEHGGGNSGVHLVQTPPAVAGHKRPYLPPSIQTPSSTHARPLEPPASEPLHKRRRLHTRSRHSLDHFIFTQDRQPCHNGQPPSPLFFSSRNSRPHLPARFSSSEAAARMLSKTRDEGEIKTVTLARGTFSGLSPPGPTSIPSGRTSERSSQPRTISPEARDRTDPLKLLGSVGIVELLEQDGRPTFIVDLGDLANYSPNSSDIHILFSNAALRSSSAIWDLVAGKPPDQADVQSTQALHHFRTWLMSPSTPSEIPDSNLAPVEHGGIVWSCFTLRKRLRVVTGAIPHSTRTSIISTSSRSSFAMPLASPMGHSAADSLDPSSSSVQNGERQDYFGDNAPAPPPGQPTPPLSAPTHFSHHAKNGSPDDGSGLLPKGSKLALPSVEDSPYFTNACVLRAQVAGDIDSFHREPTDQSDCETGFFDWTRLSLSSSLPRHIQFARSVDWASTALGPIEYWSNDLRAMCNLIM